jgi:hypothetical protein
MTASRSIESGIVLPAHRVRVFEPRRVFEERIGIRKVVYLDNNIWIYLGDAKTDEALRCLDSCLQAVNKERAIFPVSFAAISEVQDNPSAEARIRQADLMDRLCLGVALRNAELLFGLEGEAVLRNLLHLDGEPLAREEVFTGVLDYAVVGFSESGDFVDAGGEECSASLRNSAPEPRVGFEPSQPRYHTDGYLGVPEGYTPAHVDGLLAHLRSKETVTVRSLVERPDLDDFRRRHSTGAAAYAEQTDTRRAAWIAERGSRKVDLEENVQAERVALFRRHVAPAIRRVPAKVICEDLLAAPADIAGRLRELYREAAPALETFAHVLAGQSVPKRKSTKQDFWDIEHAGVAPVYADAFVTADGGLRSRLPVGVRRPPSARAAVLGSVAELRHWLDCDG